MPHITALTNDEMVAALAGLPGWRLQEGKLQRTFKFRSFAVAFGFMTQIAIEAEAMDHHPEWWNVYNRVGIALVTHSAGNLVSALDVALAHKIDSAAALAAGGSGA